MGRAGSTCSALRVRALGAHTVTAASRLGLIALIAAVLSVTLARAGNPDPMLLPAATTSQGPLTAAYNALGVPSMAAGNSYLDPTTGAIIYKLTSATYPTASALLGARLRRGRGRGVAAV
jgi:hypothetical protein